MLQTGSILTDVLFLAAVSTLVGYRLPFAPELALSLHGLSSVLVVNGNAGFLFLYAALTLILCQQYGLYDAPHTRSSLDECLAVAKAVSRAALFLTVFGFLSGLMRVAASLIVASGLLNLVTLIAWRLGEHKIIEHRVVEGVDARRVLIVGTNTVGQRLARCLAKNPQWGYVVQGFLDKSDSNSNGCRVLGRIEDLTRVAQAEFVDEILIALPWQKELDKVLQEARRSRLGVKVVADSDGLTWGAPVDYIEQIPVFSLHQEATPTLAHFTKRSIDVLGSAAGLIFLSPLLALIALAIKIDSQGPVFYRSLRVGKKGRKFVFLKFRSMVVNADNLKAGLYCLNERQGLLFKLKNDPRVTRVGGFLRKYSLDELPQLWNVLKGDMSLVGPRPPTMDEYEHYSLSHLRRLDVAPGITGLWQVSARQDPSFDKAVTLDLEYIRNWKLWLDVEILLRTVPTVLKGRGC